MFFIPKIRSYFFRLIMDAYKEFYRSDNAIKKKYENDVKILFVYKGIKSIDRCIFK